MSFGSNLDLDKHQLLLPKVLLQLVNPLWALQPFKLPHQATIPAGLPDPLSVPCCHWLLPSCLEPDWPGSKSLFFEVRFFCMNDNDLLPEAWTFLTPPLPLVFDLPISYEYFLPSPSCSGPPFWFWMAIFFPSLPWLKNVWKFQVIRIHLQWFTLFTKKDKAMHHQDIFVSETRKIEQEWRKGVERRKRERKARYLHEERRQDEYQNRSKIFLDLKHRVAW